MQIIARPKLFYGWWIVLVSLVVLFITLGLGYYSFGVFFTPLVTDFGWSRAALSGAMSLFLLAWGLASPLTGRLTDRYGPRRLIIWGTVGLGASLCLLSLTTALWQLYLLYAFAGAASAICSEIPTSTAVSHWFRRKRGIAMGVTSTGIGFGGLILAPAVNQLILSLGWQTTFVIAGVLAWVTIIPLAALVMKNRPQEIGLVPDGDSSPNPMSTGEPRHQTNANPLSRSSPVSTRDVWLMGIGFSMASFGLIGVTTHQVPYMIDNGIDATAAATALGLTAGIGVLSKLSFGYLADRFSPRGVMSACIALQAVGVVLLIQISSLGIWAFVVVFAFAMGGNNTLRPLVIGEFFDLAAFGRVSGLTEFIRRVGAAAGPFLAGYIFDITGSYRYAFITFMVAYAVGIVTLLLIRPTNHYATGR